LRAEHNEDKSQNQDNLGTTEIKQSKQGLHRWILAGIAQPVKETVLE
jgi:hypothetical protein